MSLRLKISLILVAVVSLYGLTTAYVQQKIFIERFAHHEDSEAIQKLESTAEALERETKAVDDLSKGWAYWDDSREFMLGNDVERFTRSSLHPEALERHGIDLLFFLEPSDGVIQRVRWSFLCDPDTREPINLNSFPTEAFTTSHPLLALLEHAGDDEDPGSSSAGLIETDHPSPLIVSIRPIRGTERGTSEAGVLILGRFACASLMERLTEGSAISFQSNRNAGQQGVEPMSQELLADITGSYETPHLEKSKERIDAYSTYPNIFGRPEMIIKARVDRDFMVMGGTALDFGLISNLAGGFVVLLVLTWLLQRTVLTPLSQLTQHAVQVGLGEKRGQSLSCDRQDEIGTLGREFDRMLEKLEQTRQVLVETARTAGKSEIASGILHNVGNLLNSVNLSAAMIAESTEEMSIDDLRAICDALEENADNLGHYLSHDRRGRHVQPFLKAIAQQLHEKRSKLHSEVAGLLAGMDQICDLIKSQQAYAVKASLEDSCQISAAVEEAIRISGQATKLDQDLKVIEDFSDLPEVVLDKHRLLEALVSIIQNARQSMLSSTGNSVLAVAVRRVDDRVQIVIEDNGKGIAEEDIPKIFNPGFTTKPTGQGYGLHSAAIAIDELGGSIHLERVAEGSGARFVISLPLRQPTLEKEIA